MSWGLRREVASQLVPMSIATPHNRDVNLLCIASNDQIDDAVGDDDDFFGGVGAEMFLDAVEF